MKYQITTKNRKDFLALQHILDETLKNGAVERTIRGGLITADQDSATVAYAGANVSAYFEFDKVNGTYAGALVVEKAPEEATKILVARIAKELPALKPEK